MINRPLCNEFQIATPDDGFGGAETKANWMTKAAAGKQDKWTEIDFVRRFWNRFSPLD